MVQAICQYLRAKASIVPAERSPLYLTETRPATQYWCLKTMLVVGPDNDFVCTEGSSQIRGATNWEVRLTTEGSITRRAFDLDTISFFVQACSESLHKIS